MKSPLVVKKTLSEQVSERVKSIGEARREKAEADRRVKYREQEDEMAAMMYGPDWRTKDLGHLEPQGEKRKAS